MNKFQKFHRVIFFREYNKSGWKFCFVHQIYVKELFTSRIVFHIRDFTADVPVDKR